MKLIDKELKGRNSPEDDFLPNSNIEPGTISRRCKFDSDGPRLVTGLVEDHLGDSGGGKNCEIWTTENIRGEIGVLHSNSTPIRIYIVCWCGSQCYY